jgi:hypothetical protein
MSEHDRVIIDAFTSTGESVDRIACFRAIRRCFLNYLLPHLRDVSDDDLVWRLLQLRKAGKLSGTQQKG